MIATESKCRDDPGAVMCAIIAVEQRECRDDTSMKRLAAVLTHLPKKANRNNYVSTRNPVSLT